MHQACSYNQKFYKQWSQVALKYCLTTPMKFASLLINMNFIGQAETRRTQRKTYLLPNREMPIG
jgi:hypothetical protein